MRMTGLADAVAQTQLNLSPQKGFSCVQAGLQRLFDPTSLHIHPCIQPVWLQPQVPSSQAQPVPRQELLIPPPQPTATPSNHTWEALRVPSDTPGGACFTIHVSKSPEQRL